MHQQIRLRLGVMEEQDGAGAMTSTAIEIDPIIVRRTLIDLLDTLAENGYDLEMVGGQDIEGAGEFVFAVDDRKTTACAQLLKDKGFKGVRIVQPVHGHAAHGPGGLATAIRELNLGNRRIHEIYIGIEEDGEIPFQITTIAHGEERSAAT